MNETDQQLLSRVKSGDRQAFEGLVRRYHPRVVGFLLTLLGNADDACDIAQDTFVQVYQHLGSVKSDEAFVPWMFRTAHRLGLNRLRANKVRSRWRADVDPVEQEVADPARSPHEAFLQTDLRTAVTRTIQRLPAQYSTVVWLRFGEEMKVADIARTLGLSRAATESRLRRGTQILKEELLRMFPDLEEPCHDEMQHRSQTRIPTPR